MSVEAVFENRCVLVTGGARGIGEAVVRRFVAGGANVIVLDTAVKEAEALGEELGAQVLVLRHDVTSEADWLALANHLEREKTVPDVLINNAGGLTAAVSIEEMTVLEFQRDLSLNLTSVFLGLRTVLPYMRRAMRGAIVNVSSVSGHRSQHDGPAYQAAKAGVDVLTRSVAASYAQYGIRVNSVLPSVVLSAASHGSPERLSSFLARVPIGRAAGADEVAAMVCFLASDEATYVTGAVIAVDGGYLA